MLTPNLRAHVPLLLDQRPQRGVVRIRHVLLEAEGRRDELDRHAEHLAQREHHGGRLGRRQAGQLVDRQLAQVGAAGGGREGGGARRGVFLVAPLHLLHRRPHGGHERAEGSRRPASRRRQRPARVSLATIVGRDCRRAWRAGLSASSGDKIEGDVAGQQAAAHQRVLAAVELAADRLVIGVEDHAIRRRWKPVLSFDSTQPWLMPSTLWP